MKKVYTARYHPDAHFVCGLLEAEGIEATVRNGDLFSVDGAPAIPSMCPSVWVAREDQLCKAMEIVTRHEKSIPPPEADGPAWKCAQCGEEHEAQFNSCWKCGEEKPGNG
jgi:hypothetical protein